MQVSFLSFLLFVLFCFVLLSYYFFFGSRLFQPTKFCKGQHTRGSLLLQHDPVTCSRSKAPLSVPTISCEKIVAQQNAQNSIESNWLNIREQAPGANLLRERVAGAELSRVYRH